MSGKSNIIDELRKKLAKAALAGQRGVVIQPGAIGDCILTLPLVELMKETVCPGGVDVIGRTEYTGFLPGRSCVDGVKSMDSLGLHRLFAAETDFALADGDPLITSFAEYPWIVTFLGEPGGDFEKNLIFTAHCSHGAEVITLAMKPAADSNKHISEFYREQFIRESDLAAEKLSDGIGMPMLRPTAADLQKGKRILAEAGVMPTRKPVVLQPGSGGAEKCWNIGNFISIAGTLSKEEIETVFVLGPAELERFSGSAKAEISKAGKTLTNLSLSDVLAVLSNSAGYVGNDSGITHLSAALGIRTVVVFGPSDPDVYAPVGPAVTILRGNTPGFTDTVSPELQQKAIEAMLR